MPAVTNNIQKRIEAVRWFLNRRNSFYVDKKCEMLIEALSGGYRWKEKKLPGGGRQPTFIPDKDGEAGRYSHIADSLQYLCLYVLNGGQVDAQFSTSQFGDGWEKYKARDLQMLDGGAKRPREFLFV